MEGKIKIGPVGHKSHNQGTPMVNWDEGSHSGIISQIFLSHGPDGIFSIQFQFMLDDKFILSDLHGLNTGYMFDVLALNCPHEYITGIGGTHLDNIFASSTQPHIKSLTFTTNTNEYGPFGSSNSRSEKKFEFKLGKLRQFGGFYGAYDISGLHYLGLYLQPTTVRPKSKPKTSTSNEDEIESKIVLG